MPRVTLTDRFIVGAKSAGAPQTDYFDEKNRGLSLRVAAGGLKSWTFHFTAPQDGKRVRLTLGTYPATTLAAARTKATEARSIVEAGGDPREVFAAERSGAMTVSVLIESYLGKHVRPNLRSAKEIERRFVRNVTPIIGSVPVAQLHRRDINRAVDPILRRGRPIEASRCFEDIRALLRWAVARGDIDHNPAEGMRKPATSTPRERVLTEEEIKKLWSALPIILAKSVASQRIIWICLLTAQRIGEISGMRRSELDLKNRIWGLPGARTKNGHPHKVPLSFVALIEIEAALGDIGKDDEFVFPNLENTGPLAATVVAKTIRRAQIPSKDKPAGRLEMTPWTAHDLRRTAVTGMAQLGIAPIVLGHVVNHRSITKAGVTLSVYAHYSYETEKRDALDRWAKQLGGIISGEHADTLY